MDKISKIAKTAAGSAPDMAKINAQSLRELTKEEVFTFKVAACNTLTDRAFEHFTEASLRKMAELYVGKTVIFDHSWSAANQTARVYDSYVEAMDGGKQLILLAYMLRKAETQALIDAIEGGILREVSVCFSCKKLTCDICGKDIRSAKCPHFPGLEYDGVTCTATLEEITDVYEVSFVAVPAQPAAGVTKSLEKTDAADEGKAESEPNPKISADDVDALALEKIRYV